LGLPLNHAGFFKKAVEMVWEQKKLDT